MPKESTAKDKLYADVIAFLSVVEGKAGKKRKQRTILSPAKLSNLRRRFPGIPGDYLAYLKEVG